MVAVASWWLLRPGALAPVANAVGLEARDDRPRLTSDVVWNTRPVELISVRPALIPPEGATVTFVACRWRDPLDAFATASGSLDEHCAETREVAGLRLEPHGRASGRTWDVVAAFELGYQSSYVTEGFVVEYRKGVRRGRQTTGSVVGVFLPGHDPFEQGLDSFD